MSGDCNGKTEVYSRVTGFYRPVQSWNGGKVSEFFDRRTYRVPAAPPAPKADTPTQQAAPCAGRGACAPGTEPRCSP